MHFQVCELDDAAWRSNISHVLLNCPNNADDKIQEVSMLYFLLEVIGVSILVSIFATWIKLIPRYPRKKYNLIQQLTNTGLLTAVLTLLFSFEIYPSWLLLFVIILLILWLSVRLTNNLVQKTRDSMVRSLLEGASKRETQSR